MLTPDAARLARVAIRRGDPPRFPARWPGWAALAAVGVGFLIARRA